MVQGCRPAAACRRSESLERLGARCGWSGPLCGRLAADLTADTALAATVRVGESWQRFGFSFSDNGSETLKGYRR